MRVLIGSLGHESNTFTPFLTTEADFFARYGDEILNSPHRGGSLGGILDVLSAHGVELIPSVAAGAMPGGVVERATYEKFKALILEAAHDVDAVCFALHGAMRAEGLDYAENDLLRDLHAQLGSGVPIVIALDMHANLIKETMQYIDALVAYHRAPHTDAFETGQAAARMLMLILERGIKPAVGFAKLPFLLPGEKAQTAIGAMKTMIERVEALEQEPGILSASLMNGHCWADVPDVGVISVVVTDGDPARAQREADRLAAEFWALRHEFGVGVESYGVREAVGRALAASESTVFLSDSGDNPGAGGATDVPVLLQALIEQGAKSVLFASIWDAEAVRACMQAGVGQTVTLSVGGKIDTRHGTPLQVTGRVRLLTDGVPYRGGLRLPWGRGRFGPVAVLNINGIDLILSSTRLDFGDPLQLRALGLEPLDYRIVVLKRGYLTTPFEVIAPRSILAFTPGATNCDVARMTFARVKRPIYPLDPEMDWTP
ncbi:MAG: M81 family metallopeptidase [Anaerolineae bacterium]|nr:M81 family metallopeptidase [Anaerolineae bacterium]